MEFVPAAALFELNECRKLNPDGYIKIQAFDASRGVESCALAFIASRPATEPGFYISRTEGEGRFQKYSFASYAVAAKPAGTRY